MFEFDGSMRRAMRGLGAGLVAIVLASPSFAQQAVTAPPAEPPQETTAPVVVPKAPVERPAQRKSAAPKARKEVARELTIEQQDATAVLDSLIEQAHAIDDEATRIRVEGRVAELLYEGDRERARKVFRKAFDEIESLNESSVDPAYAPVGARLTLRVELLSTLYRVDPVLAAQLASTLDEDPENYDGGGMPFENQSDLSATMLRVAQSLASSDPKLSASLARQSIVDGVPVEFAILLPALGESDRNVADALATEALRVAGTAGYSLVDIAGALPYVFPEVEQYGRQQAFANTRSSSLRSALLLAAFNVTSRYASGLNARLTGNANDDAEPWSIFAGEGLAVNYEIAEQLVPLFDAVDPDRSGAFRGMTAQIANAMPVELRASISTSIPKAGLESPESIAAKAETLTDVRLREDLYSRAAMLAADRGDIDLAKSYAGRIEDVGRRASVRSTVALQAIRKALSERRYDDARKLAKDIVEIRMRASAYTQIASEMAASGKRLMAADCLDEAQVALIKDDAVMTREKAEALVRVANAYAGLDPNRAFDVMRSALDAVNTGLRRGDGYTVSPQASAKRNPGVVFQLGALDPSSGLEALARVDYYRSMGLARGLDSKALTVLAQIGVIRGVLRFRYAPPAQVRAPAPVKAPAGAPAVAPVASPQVVAPGDATAAPPETPAPVVVDPRLEAEP